MTKYITLFFILISHGEIADKLVVPYGFWVFCVGSSAFK